jgi:hypothetical protein
MQTEGGGKETTGSSEWNRLLERAPEVLLAVGMVVSAAIILSLSSKLTFIADEWNLLLLRQGWGVGQIMEPFNGHPIMAPSFIFKSLQEVFGMESARPMQVAATGTFLLVNALLFVYLRRRIGAWAALIGTSLILFLGASFENLLFAFQIGYFGSLAAGIGAFLALDRDDRKGDIAAALLLVVGLMFSSLGIAFTAAAAVEWLTNPRTRKARWFVPGAPILFYGLWWLVWGHQPSPQSLDPSFELSVLPKVPGYMFDSFAAALTSLAGLATGDGSEPDQPNLVWGQIGAVAFIGFAIWRLRRLRPVPRAFLVTTAGALCLFFLFAIAQDAYLQYGDSEFRAATSSRYQLPTAVFVVLVASTLLEGVRFSRWTLGVAGVLAIFAISGGIQLMDKEANERWIPAATYTRATLSGVELAGADNVAGHTFRPGTAFDVSSEQYLSAVEAHGSPAYSEPELRGEDQTVRLTADASLIGSAGVALTGTPPQSDPSTCRTVGVGEPVELAGGSFLIENAGTTDLSVSAARTADPPGTLIGSVLPSAAAGLRLPAGSSSSPWVLSFAGEGPVGICSAG